MISRRHLLQLGGLTALGPRLGVVERFGDFAVTWRERVEGTVIDRLVADRVGQRRGRRIGRGRGVIDHRRLVFPADQLASA